MQLSDAKYLLTQSFKDWNEDKASVLAAALAYYTVFSIPPLLIIAIAIAGRVFKGDEQQITAEIVGFIGESGGRAIAAILENASRPDAGLIVAIISAITLLLGASGVFGRLQDAMNTIWEVQPRLGRGVLGVIADRFFSFTMVLGVGFLLLVSLILSAALAGVSQYASGALADTAVVAQIVNQVVSLLVTGLLFALIFKIVPDVKIAWRDVWLGAAVTAVLFALGRWGISMYLAYSAPGSAYGAAGSLIVILLWVYYSALILFFGAEFTQVYARRYGADMQPEEGAIAMTEAHPIQASRAAREPETAALAYAGRGGRRALAHAGRNVATRPSRPPAAPRGLQRAVNGFYQKMVAAAALVTAVGLWLRPRRRRTWRRP
ncbi:MAG: YihY/virulence factor BrkB family protein [Candidatus Promineifilaceae bacterium]